MIHAITLADHPGQVYLFRDGATRDDCFQELNRTMVHESHYKGMNLAQMRACGNAKPVEFEVTATEPL